MSVLGVVGLVSRDVVDGGPPRVGGPPFYAGRALIALGERAVIATKFAAEDADLVAPLLALGVPVASRAAAQTIAFRIDRGNGERRMAIERLGETWTPEEARGWLAEALAEADAVHAGALTRADFPPETLAELRRGRLLSLDGQALVRPARTGPLELDARFDHAVLAHVDVLKLSEPEAQALAVSLDAGSLASLGVAEVVVTLGVRGSVVFAGGGIERVRADPVRGVDDTGAGDMFAVAYLAARRAGEGAGAAARHASALVSGLLAGRLG